MTTVRFQRKLVLSQTWTRSCESIFKWVHEICTDTTQPHLSVVRYCLTKNKSSSSNSAQNCTDCQTKCHDFLDQHQCVGLNSPLWRVWSSSLKLDQVKSSPVRKLLDMTQIWRLVCKITINKRLYSQPQMPVFWSTSTYDSTRIGQQPMLVFWSSVNEWWTDITQQRMLAYEMMLQRMLARRTSTYESALTECSNVCLHAVRQRMSY